MSTDEMGSSTDDAADARVYERPDEFIPERWTSRPELTKDDTLLAPFSVGM